MSQQASYSVLDGSTPRLYCPYQLISGNGQAFTVYSRSTQSTGQMGTWGPINITPAGTRYRADYHGISSCQAFGTWSGLSSTSGPVTCSMVANYGTRVIEFSLVDDSTADFSFSMPLPSVTFKMAWGTSGSVVYSFPDRVLTITPGSGNPFSLSDPYIPLPNPLLAMAGKKIKVPFFADKAGDFVIEVGDKSFLVPIDDAGKVHVFEFEIPPNWNGFAKFGGVNVDVALSLWRPETTGAEFGTQNPANPADVFSSSIYDDALPPGMTRVHLNDLPLPAGMTRGSKLPLPSGMTVAQNDSIGTLDSFTVTRGGVTSTSVVDNASTNSTTVPSTGSGSSSTTVTGGGVATAAESSAKSDATSLAAVKGAVDGSTDLKPEEAAKVVAGEETVNGLAGSKMRIVSMFSNFSPLSKGQSIPRTNSYALNWNFGPFGTVQKNIDFDAQPFPILRTAELIVFTLIMGNAFMKRLTI